MTPKSDHEAATQQFIAALSHPAPRFYANGFQLGQSLSDITMVLQANNATVAVVNLSFTSAKTLAMNLQNIIKTFEDATGQPLLTMDEIATKTGQVNES